MIPTTGDAWRRAMGEASCLLPDDPERREMEAEVARRGGLVEREWMGLLEEAERWRIELRRLDVPEGLEDRLLLIPRAAGARASVLRPRLLRLVALAAVVLLGIGGGWWLLGPGRPPPDPLRTLALLALSDHLDTHRLEVTTEDPAVLREGLQERIPFPIRLPALGGAPRLEGGRRCTLGSHPVCFTTWRLEGARMTLLQLRRADFDLPADMAPAIVTPSGAAAGHRPLDVLLWTEGDDAYALVADDPVLLRRLQPTGR